MRLLAMMETSKKKSTSELEEILGKTHPNKIGEFITDNKESLLDSDRPFYNYYRKLVKDKKKKLQDIFLQADIPEKYGYKLVSGEKRTKQRDVIIRLLYSAELSLDEAQEGLKIYGMPQLYAKVPRDALLMVCFNERPGSVIDVNSCLSENKMEPLRNSGYQE